MIGIIDTENKLNDAIALLTNDDVAIKRIAARALCTSVDYSKVPFETAITALTNALTDQDGYVRERCVEAIGKAAKYLVLIPEQTVTKLRKSMRNDESQSVREKAEQALVDCGKLKRETNGSPDQLHLFAWRSMGEGYALLRRMKRARQVTPKPRAQPRAATA